MALYGFTILPYFNSTDFDSLFMQFLATSLKWGKRLILDLLVSALITEHIELFEDFRFFGVGPATDKQHFVETEGTSTANYVSDVVSLTDVVQQQISFRFIALHIK